MTDDEMAKDEMQFGDGKTPLQKQFAARICHHEVAEALNE